MRKLLLTAVATTLIGITASSASAATLFVVHGIPGVPVDVYAGPAGSAIPSTPNVPNFQPKSVLRVTAGPGTFDIRIFAVGANPQTAMPVISVLGAAIPATGELSIVAHLSENGTPRATVYRNDNTTVPSGWARVSVRHAASAPAVQLAVNGLPKLAVSNPYFGDLEVAAATAIQLQLQIPFTGAAVTPPGTLSFNAGTRYFVYAIGSLSGGTFDFIVHTAP